MPIKYGTTTMSTVKYGSTTLQTVKYGSTTVYTASSGVTINVVTNDTSYVDSVWISTSNTGSPAYSTIVVADQTPIYFFVKLKRALPEYYRNTRWQRISGTDWSAGAVYRVQGGRIFYYTQASPSTLYTEWVYESGNVVWLSNSGNTYIVNARSFIEYAGGQSYGIETSPGSSEGDSYFELEVLNYYHDLDVMISYYYIYFETSTGGDYEEEINDFNHVIDPDGGSYEFYWNSSVQGGEGGLSYWEFHAYITTPNHSMNPYLISWEL